jgi:hypothetical protein
MGGACSMQGIDDKYKVSIENPMVTKEKRKEKKRRDETRREKTRKEESVTRPRRSWKAIIKKDPKYDVRLCIGLLWLRTGPSSGSYYVR